MNIAVWTNKRGEQMLVNVLGLSRMNAGYVMIQKITAQPGHGIFSVSPSNLVML